MHYPDIGLVKIKETERIQIQHHTEAFIASGGKIDLVETHAYSKKSFTPIDDLNVLPPGESSADPFSLL